MYIAILFSPVSTAYKALEGIPVILGDRYQASESLTTLPLKYSPSERLEESYLYNMELEKYVLSQSQSQIEGSSIKRDPVITETTLAIPQPLKPVVVSEITETIESQLNRTK